MERWRQIEFLFEEALQHDPADRDAWLRRACRGDSDLRREVASLLASHQEGAGFEPWAAAAAAQLIDGPVSLHAGQRLGPYEILGPIGVGGMGEVYKARDTRLKRDVAIKIWTGVPQPLLEDVSLTGLAGSANLDFSPAPSGSGTFVYLSRTSEPTQSLFWLDSVGKTQPLQRSAPGSVLNPRFSPDGKRLAFATYASDSQRRADIWV